MPVLLSYMDLDRRSPFYPYTMLPSAEPSSKSVTISPNGVTIERSSRSTISNDPLKAIRSVTRTDLDIYSESGNGIPASNFRLLTAWVKHCEHSAGKHGKQAKYFKLLHLILATLSLGTVASMTVVSAIIPKSNLATVIQSSIAAFIMGLMNVLDLQGRAKNHLVANGEFTLMGREIATTLGTIEEERNWNELCRMYQRQMDVTESHAPPI
jgi:hypothetical protein